MSSSKMASVSALPPFLYLETLPEELLVEILSKLPAKSLVRFKCVSKFFCSLMVDHPFADLHRKWSLTLPSRMSILISVPIDIEDARLHCRYTIKYPEENQGTLHANRLRYIDFDRNFFGKLYISSSLNGLICFCTYSRRGDAIAIHNLSTRQHISLPSSCPTVGGDSESRITAFGLLGFDSVLKRYKVLKSVQYTDRYWQHVSAKHWVFTLGVDESWREIHSSPSYHPDTCFNNHFYFCTSIHVDGVIYSLNSLNKGEIVAFNVSTETFRAIPPPPLPGLAGLEDEWRVAGEACEWLAGEWLAGRQAGEYSDRSGFVEVDGRLAIVDLFISENRDNLWRYGMKIWILEESMVWKNQYLIFIPIPMKEIDHNNKRVLFVATNHVGEIAVLVKQNISVSILFYNFRRQSWRKFDISKLPMNPSMYPAMYFTLDNVF